MSLHYQSEMSAEDLLDEYLEKEDNSLMDIMSEGVFDDNKSVRIPSRNGYDQDFKFLGSGLNDYNHHLQK